MLKKMTKKQKKKLLKRLAFPPEYKAIGAMPPGTYTGTMEKIRKVRNKPYYRMTLKVQGHKIISILPMPKDED